MDSIYVEELRTTMSRQEILNCLVLDILVGSIDVDWRDFFPYLNWIPNRSFENRIKQLDIRRTEVMKSLIKKTKMQSAFKEVVH